VKRFYAKGKGQGQPLSSEPSGRHRRGWQEGSQALTHRAAPEPTERPQKGTGGEGEATAERWTLTDTVWKAIGIFNEAAATPTVNLLPQHPSVNNPSQFRPPIGPAPPRPGACRRGFCLHRGVAHGSDDDHLPGFAFRDDPQAHKIILPG
jgi:hypothetical protein